MTSKGTGHEPSPARHLHPLALFGFFIQTLREWLIPIISGIVGSFALYKNHPILFITIITILVLFAIVWPLLAYFTFTYQLLPQEILVKHGLVFRKQNHVPYDRIQNVAVRQWFFLRPFNLVELEVETAGHSAGPEVTLTAVSLSLRDELTDRRQEANRLDAENNQLNNPKIAGTTAENSLTHNAEREQEPDLTYHIRTSDLLKFAATSPAFLTALLAIMAVYGRLQNIISQGIYARVFKDLGQAGWIVIIAGLLGFVLLLYVGSIAAIVIQYYKFTLTRSNGQLVMAQGLFQRNTVSLAQNRIQAIRVSQPLLRSWLRVATVKLVIISNAKKDQSSKNLVIMPVIAQDKVDAFITEFIADVPVSAVTAAKQSGRTMFYQLRNFGLGALAILLVMSPLFRLVPVVSAITIVLLILFLIIPAYLIARRTQVQVLDDAYAFAQTNFLFTREQYYLPRRNIQSMVYSQSKWLAQRHFASLIMDLRSGSDRRRVVVRYLPSNVVRQVFDWYKN